MGPRGTIAHVKGSRAAARHVPARERVAIVGLLFGTRRRAAVDASLDELAGLASTAGATVVHRVIQGRARPDPALFLGRGKAKLLARICAERNVDVVVADDELTPAQLRNLEAVLERRVIDRTQLILDIFASRARTREGRLQIELAQLRYLLPRLAGTGVDLSRLGAGIGTRGPGETKLETDRRRIRYRISRLSRDLALVRRRRAQLRERRRKRATPTVALVGYTNAGKTTLFNLLTGSAAESSEALFATLDPLLRQLQLPDRRSVLISDTVGFIERLPHTLVAAFQATLEEVANADLLLHVVDVADSARAERMAAVGRVLEEVGASDLPAHIVFNKCDLLVDVEVDRIRHANPEALFVSAVTSAGHKELVDAVTRTVHMDTQRLTLHFDDRLARDRRRIAQVYRHGHVLQHVSNDGRVLIEVEVPTQLVERWRAGETMARRQRVVGH